MLQSVYIKNFRAWDEATITLDGKHAVFVGENDSGKTSVLQALDCFFNCTRIPASFVREPKQPVEIGVRYAGTFYKRVFAGQTHQLEQGNALGEVDKLRFAYLPSTTNVAGVMLELEPKLLECVPFPELILGVDEVEGAFAPVGYASVLPVLQERIGQLLFTTRSSEVAENRGSAQIVPVGDSPSKSTADVLKGMRPKNRTYLLVEGKYDLPWFKTALKLLGATKRFYVLPSGGSNIDELRKALASVSLPTIAIVDGDTLPNPKKKKFALQRDCVELYAPESLLRELFRIVPPATNKDAFFGAIQEVRPNMSRDGIKDAIAERISEHLTVENEFVQEIAEIIKTP